MRFISIPLAAYLLWISTAPVQAQALAKGGNNPYTGRSLPGTSTYNPYTASTNAVKPTTNPYRVPSPQPAKGVQYSDNEFLARKRTASQVQQPFTGKAVPNPQQSVATVNLNAFIATTAPAEQPANPYLHSSATQQGTVTSAPRANPYVETAVAKGNPYTRSQVSSPPRVNPYTNQVAAAD
jgi:hypothetical protein